MLNGNIVYFQNKATERVDVNYHNSDTNIKIIIIV